MPEAADHLNTAIRSDWRMPAEWEAHERTVIAWPTRASLWGPYAERAKAEYAATANAIVDFEPVTMIVAPGQAAEVTSGCSSAVDTLELPIDDSWIRDSGPIIVTSADGRRSGVNFVFNSWGEKFLPYDNDAAIAGRLLERLGIDRIDSPLVCEGGAITVDGEGTLITTEQCLANHNRNPLLSRDQIDEELRLTLGVRKVVWLKWGGYEDAHTDGHVDGVCTYVRPGVVIAQTCDDPKNPNFVLMEENLEILRTARDAKGRPIEIIALPQLPYIELDGTEVVVSYPNFYVVNGAVIVPTADAPCDSDALAIIGSAFPGLDIVGVSSRVIAYGGGGMHCITQQIPGLK